MEEASDTPCAHCKAISPHNGKRTYGGYNIPYERVDQYPNFPALETNARRGCRFCGLLRHALQDKYSDKKIAEAERDFHPSIRAKWPLEWNAQVTVGHGGFSTEDDWAERDTTQNPDQSLHDIYDLALKVWPYPPRRNDCSAEANFSWLWFPVYADNSEWQICVMLCLLMISGSRTSLQGASRRRQPDSEALSQANVLLISEWLRTCSRLHNECRHQGDVRLPTRIIVVGPADNSQAPRLVTSSNESGEYVALSHCWGSLLQSDAGNYARTLKANIKDMQCGIPLEKLPQNFQDAILTVRKLGLRFLWIDALCIIQDDLMDWAREAARMNMVYGLAYLTIVATSAVSSTDGFLKRIQDKASSFSFHKDDCAESVDRLLMAYRGTDGDQGSWNTLVEGARWNTRGWTLQERLLSRRVLHFTERKLFWECRATDASEENEPPRTTRHQTSWLKDKSLDVLGSSKEQCVESLESCFDGWYSIVSEYAAFEFSCSLYMLKNHLATLLVNSAVKQTLCRPYPASLKLSAPCMVRESLLATTTTIFQESGGQTLREAYCGRLTMATAPADAVNT